MFSYSLSMIFASRSKFLAILVGVAFSSLIMLQQPAIFLGLMDRTYWLVTDTKSVDIWVMDPQVTFIDDAKPMNDKELYRVKGIRGVKAAIPMFKGAVKVRTKSGQYLTMALIGVDRKTLLGAPTEILSGSTNSLRHEDAMIVSEDIATKHIRVMEGGVERNLQVGDSFEVNDLRAVVAAVARLTPAFTSKPVAYTTYSRALEYSPAERNKLSFVLVQVEAGADPENVARRIGAHTGLLALTSKKFADMTYNYYLEKTGIPINFAATVLLGFIIGASIVAQTFYLFLHENRMNYTVLRALGAKDFEIAKMICLQLLLCGTLGYVVGMVSAVLFGDAIQSTQLAWRLPGSLLLAVYGLTLIICLPVAFFSVHRVLRSKPAEVFRTET